MNWKFLPVLIFSGILFLAHPASAQQENLPPGRVSLKFIPQHLLVNGLAFEYEKGIKANSRQTISVSPRVYFGKTRTVDYFAGRENGTYPSDVKGGGVELLHRIYPKMAVSEDQNFYWAYGLNYHYFNVQFEAEAWLQERGRDGLLYYVYRQGTFQERINRLGLTGMMGIQNTFLKDKVFTDLYAGLGYHHSFIQTSFPNPRFSANLLDFGNKGLYLATGLKIGMWL